jgi:hypothetical protein
MLEPVFLPKSLNSLQKQGTPVATGSEIKFILTELQVMYGWKEPLLGWMQAVTLVHDIFACSNPTQRKTTIQEIE